MMEDIQQHKNRSQVIREAVDQRNILGEKVTEKPEPTPPPGFDPKKKREQLHIATDMAEKRPGLKFVYGFTEVAYVDYGEGLKGRMSPFLVTDPEEENNVGS